MNIINRFKACSCKLITTIVMTAIMLLTIECINVYASIIYIRKDDSGVIESIKVNGTTYTDMNRARSALLNAGVSTEEAAKIISGQYGTAKNQAIYISNIESLDDARTVSRAEAKQLVEDYKNGKVFYGEEYIKYTGEPLDDFDTRNSRDYNTYSNYLDATRQGISLSQQVTDTYSITHLISTTVQSWDENMSKGQYNKAVTKLHELSAQLNKGTDYEKIKNTATYLVKNIDYDYSQTYGDIYHAICEGKGVCTGYAECFQLIMEDMGIESYIYTDPTHALNIVKLEGKYYFVDITNMYNQNNKDDIKWKFLLFGTNLREDKATVPVSATSYTVNEATAAPTVAPTQAPTQAPTEPPTQAPTQAPTEPPTQAPTQAPTEPPTQAPTQAPTEIPTQAPTEAVTEPITTEAASSAIDNTNSTEQLTVQPETSNISSRIFSVGGLSAILAGLIALLIVLIIKSSRK